MAQHVVATQIPDPFKGLLSKTKVVQNSILERTEKKISLLEGRNFVRLYSRNGSPPSLNSELDISSPNFIALSESYFIVKLRYEVSDSRANGARSYPHWVCTTSPAFSWFKNIRVELNGTEVTQSSKVQDMQSVQHILSLMESDVAKLQYSDSDLYGLQKLDPQKCVKDIPLGNYRYGVKRSHAYAFATNTDGEDDFDGTTLKRRPTVHLSNEENFSNTVLENVARVTSGHFQFKMRPFLPFFNVDDAWLPPGTQIKIRFDLPQTQLSRYMIVSDRGGGGNSLTGVGPVNIDLLQLDFVYPTYRMDKAYVDQVRLPKELYFHTWCPRLVQKSLTDDAGTLELLHNSDIPRRMILFFSDLKLGEDAVLGGGAASNFSNRLAMVHANLSQLRVTINDESVFDSPLKFRWECSENSDAKHYYDYNKSSYLRGYNLVQEFFGKTYGAEIPITASDYCNHYFMIPINLNLDRMLDNEKVRGNMSLDYQFANVANAPINVPSHASTSIKVNLLCLDQYMYTMSKEEGIKWETV
ncbi:uncharacterized protein LOC135826084 [Sycon ciliatum]|uniref:uncharacterized protein LOC135826084 n=1 Tax=Sycon ciliatum TaxID=27933 RepID=UPI0031F63270